MNILISTTKGWNPGDEFIYGAVESLLTAVFTERQKRFFLFTYNRNPDFFVNFPVNRTMKVPLHSQLNLQALPGSFFDLIVMAGTPECFGDPVIPIYEYVKTNKTKLLILAAGWSLPKLILSDLEKEVLSYPTTQVTVRQEDLISQLKEQTGREFSLEICPSVLVECPDYKNKNKLDTGVIVQALDGPQKSTMPFKKEFLEEHSRGLIAFTPYDYVYYKERGYDPWYLQEPAKTIVWINSFKTIYSQRLHGYLIALGLGKKATLHYDPTDHRMKSCYIPLKIDKKKITEFYLKTIEDLLALS